MTSSPLSGSESGPLDNRVSAAYALLHERVQRWIWEKGWAELRDAQERAIPVVLEGKRDVIIAAATAAGKTEAALLPICSRLVDDCSGGFRALLISPLKALINDQFRRLEELGSRVGVSVGRWHGDVPASQKKKLLEEPSGLLLITPESLEALFVLHGYRLRGLFARLEYVVVDELHVYLGTERGKHVQSLLHRVDLVLRRRLPRIGLSATLGDMSLAAEYLRPGLRERVELICSGSGDQELLAQIRGYRIAGGAWRSAQRSSRAEGDDRAEQTGAHMHAIASHLYRTLRGRDNLVFANSRVAVEKYADQLRRLSERARVPNEFLPHHGNLSKEIREDVESRLKDPSTPTTAVCTSTLELGIDVGEVTSIAQIGAPFSVASLRQRLGRSGRRGAPAILRLYVSERDLDAKSHLLDGLRIELMQAARCCFSSGAIA